MAQVVFENIRKTYPARQGDTSAQSSGLTDEGAMESRRGNTVLQGIDLTIADGEFMVLVGPSGCGKSTLLRMLAGLESVTQGQIYVGDRPVTHLPPKARDIAMVFQSYALYPHLSVYDNIAFGLRRQTTGTSVPQRFPTPLESLLTATTRGFPKGLRYRSEREIQIRDRVLRVAQMLQIDPLLTRLPKQLSGGQKQRVALGRAIARNPQVFLMDEPLSNLDAKLRAETRSQIVSLQKELGITTLYVTHDQIEAMTMGQRIAVLSGGSLQQVGSPLDLYNRPANRFVAEFLGSPPMNFIPVQVQAPLQILHPEFRFTVPQPWFNLMRDYDGQTLWLGIRPEHLSGSVPATKNLRLQVQQVEALGSETYVQGTISGHPDLIQARLDPSQTPRPGDEIWLAFDPEQIHFFHPQTTQALYPI